MTQSSRRQLEKWTPEPSTQSQTLEEFKGAGQWDQFATNERMFGVKSSYSEDIYTTKLDRSHPDFNKRYKQADVVAKEIESKVSSNPHLAEERGHVVDDSGVDEEDKYAGVIRLQQGTGTGYAAALGKYTPPAKREAIVKTPETKVPSVSAENKLAAVDPAIISSKLMVESDRTASSSTVTLETEKERPSLPATSTAPVSTPTVASVAAEGTVNGTIPTIKEPEDQAPQIQEAAGQFLRDEKKKLLKARTKEKQRQLSEFAQFSSQLTLTMPVPTDLLPILAGKDATKQKALLERNLELQKKIEERKSQSPKSSPSSSGTVVATKASSSTVQSPITSPAPTLAERLRSNQSRPPTSIPSPIASPTPLEPGVVKPVATSPVVRKLDPSAKEFVFKPSAKEFKPSFGAPQTHSPSPSRVSVVSSPPVRPRADRPESKSGKAGFWDKKPRRKEPRESIEDMSPLLSIQMEFKTTPDGEVIIAHAYATPPAWPLSEGDDSSTAKGYLDILTEDKTTPNTPTSGHDDHSQSGHNYSRSSSVHPPSLAPPTQLLVQSPIMQGYTTSHPMYPPMTPLTMNQFGFMIPQAGQLPPGVPQGPFTPQQILQAQFPQQPQNFRYQTSQYPSPSPLLSHAIPTPPQYQPNPNVFPNGQFPPGFQNAPPMYTPVPPYAYMTPQPQTNGGNGATGGYNASQSTNGQQMFLANMHPMYPSTSTPQHSLRSMLITCVAQQQQFAPLRTPPQGGHVHPHSQGYSPGRGNGVYNVSSGNVSLHGSPSHSRRQSTQPIPSLDEDK